MEKQRLPSLFPICKTSVLAHLSALGYCNIPESIVNEFVNELQEYETVLTNNSTCEPESHEKEYEKDTSEPVDIIIENRAQTCHKTSRDSDSHKANDWDNNLERPKTAPLNRKKKFASRDPVRLYREHQKDWKKQANLHKINK
ncbi:hypothetical protein ROZALSC1DRAFT_28478 [Rozella allomycis CSF55]|uniref:Uncharacterized protein n=1 Tax=Rozella allomycis (strain CSF55) TaxID=988480 RepID=A0A075ASP7_ROZAC|nr:hypothetical protein O9G_001144 [Rozella allomycis CSF55]RKP19981.1 hypothetical protein ROZALSC1DRAFT_28478 [Rozella allomycis CSF55]|eukprot:EPZ33175.1 hypothetical protein O9G_001144 [Rozella allomycis CSF55]